MCWDSDSTCMVHTSLVPRPSGVHINAKKTQPPKTSSQHTPVENMITYDIHSQDSYMQSDEMFLWLLYTQYTQAVNHYVTTVLKFIHRHSPYQHTYRGLHVYTSIWIEELTPPCPNIQIYLPVNKILMGRFIVNRSWAMVNKATKHLHGLRLVGLCMAFTQSYMCKLQKKEHVFNQ